VGTTCDVQGADDVMDDLADAWARLTEPLGFDEEPSRAAFAELMRQWTEPHRAYHVLAHLRHVLATIDTLLASGEPVDDAVAVRLAAWYHDAVYDPAGTGNEAASAGLAEGRLRGLGLPAARAARVGALVRVTADHRPAPADPAARVLSDADLAVLASEPGPYDLYRRAVRVEYGWLDEEAWRAGRSAFCRGMLARESIFATATLRARGERAARRNLTAELTELEGRT